VVIVALSGGLQRKASLKKILFSMIPTGLLFCIYRGINFGKPEIGDLEALILLVFIIYILGRGITLRIIRRGNQSKKGYMNRFEFNMIIFYDVLAILSLLAPVLTIVAPRFQGGWVAWLPGMQHEWMFPFMFILFPAFWLLSALIFLAGLLSKKNKHPFLAFLPFLVLLGVYQIPIWMHLTGNVVAFFLGLFSIMLIIHIVITIMHQNRISSNLKERV